MKKNYVGVFANLLFVVLMACVMSVSPALGQVYFHDNFNSSASLDNWEIGGEGEWLVEGGELVTRGAAESWNCIIVKEALWEGWANYTYELTVTPELDVRPGVVIYQIFRYAQTVSADRENFLSWMMNGGADGGLYIDRFVDTVRTSATDDLVDTMYMDDTWRNTETHVFKLEVTAETIAGYIDGELIFGPLPEANLIDGRIGMGTWGSDVRFDEVRVIGPAGGTAVEPVEKLAATWGQLKEL